MYSFVSLRIVLLGAHNSVVLFAIASIVEMLAEPAFIFSQAHLLVGARVLVEGNDNFSLTQKS